MPLRLSIALLTLGVLTASAFAADNLERGRAIVEENCGRCHATGPEGDSPLAAAPAFRTLAENYPVGDLAEALAEGIVTGHPAMPEFEFDPGEIDAVIAYLESIQSK
jgi:mono/diheme cytochrome c family protein